MCCLNLLWYSLYEALRQFSIRTPHWGPWYAALNIGVWCIQMHLVVWVWQAETPSLQRLDPDLEDTTMITVTASLMPHIITGRAFCPWDVPMQIVHTFRVKFFHPSWNTSTLTTGLIHKAYSPQSTCFSPGRENTVSAGPAFRTDPTWDVITSAAVVQRGSLRRGCSGCFLYSPPVSFHHKSLA